MSETEDASTGIGEDTDALSAVRKSEDTEDDLSEKKDEMETNENDGEKITIRYKKKAK